MNGILSNSNPATAGKFYVDSYVMIPSDQIIIRSNIKMLSELQNSIEREDLDTKAHLNDLYTKSGNLKQGEECAKCFDEHIITTLRELEGKVKHNLDYMKNKEELCRDMFRGTLLKNKSAKDPRNKTNERARKESS